MGLGEQTAPGPGETAAAPALPPILGTGAALGHCAVPSRVGWGLCSPDLEPLPWRGELGGWVERTLHPDPSQLRRHDAEPRGAGQEPAGPVACACEFLLRTLALGRSSRVQLSLCPCASLLTVQGGQPSGQGIRSSENRTSGWAESTVGNWLRVPSLPWASWSLRADASVQAQ